MASVTKYFERKACAMIDSIAQSTMEQLRKEEEMCNEMLQRAFKTITATEQNGMRND